MKHDAQTIYSQYQKSLEYQQSFMFFDKVDECYKFYKGDQWETDKINNERQPSYNIIAPIVDYKVATVAADAFSLNYSPLVYGKDFDYAKDICDKLNKHAQKVWEYLDMDTVMWDIIKDSCIAGDAYLYFYYNEETGQIEKHSIDTTNIFLADEQQKDIQKQKYIIIRQRKHISEIKEIANKNGIAEDEISLIMPDEEYDDQLGDKAKKEIEVDEDGKAILLSKIYKENGQIYIVKCTKNVIVQKDTLIDGMKLYPIVGMRWAEDKGSARGTGEVYFRIPNQIQLNKTLARNLVAIKQTAYPHIIYNKQYLTPDQAKRLSVVGATIGVGDKNPQNVVEDIKKVIGYMQPAQMNNNAISIVSELISNTRELAGAGDIAEGSVNPEQASGAAIIAVREAKALPLSSQKANAKQSVEGIARVFFDMLIAYNPNGLEIEVEQKDKQGNKIPVLETINTEYLTSIKVNIKVDVSPANPFSKYAREQALQSALTSGQITFEQYVDALDDDAIAPKEKFKNIVDDNKLKEAAAIQAKLEMNQKILNQGQPGGQTPVSNPENEKSAAIIEQLMNENANLKSQIGERTDGNNDN